MALRVLCEKTQERANLPHLGDGRRHGVTERHGSVTRGGGWAAQGDEAAPEGGATPEDGVTPGDDAAPGDEGNAGSPATAPATTPSGRGVRRDASGSRGSSASDARPATADTPAATTN